MTTKQFTRASAAATAVFASLAATLFFLSSRDAETRQQPGHARAVVEAPAPAPAPVAAPAPAPVVAAPEPAEAAPLASFEDELDLRGAIAAFAEAVATDSSGISTENLVHLDTLFQNLAIQADNETSK